LSCRPTWRSEVSLPSSETAAVESNGQEGVGLRTAHPA
jgi:hypothetical protein